jgi:5-(carboxyamino)imidazole ribonucleotide synthase
VGQTVGMIGGGQLARMTHQAAIALDIKLRVLAAAPADSAAQVTPDAAVGSVDSYEDLAAFAESCDVLTFDHEVIDPAFLAKLHEHGHVLHPAPHANLLAQDKLEQRRRLAAAGLPVPAHRPVEEPADAVAFGEAHGWPLVLKAVRGGYDGRGVWVVDDPDDARRVVHAARADGTRLLAEAHVALDREVAVLVARSPGGAALAYPLIETVQRDGMLHELVVPARVPAPTASAAVALGLAIAEEIDATGVMAAELFVSGGEVSVNELALRPHNSGHWTIEGATTSQFDNHLRAVLGWELGPTTMVAPAAATANIIGPADGSDPRAALPGVSGLEGARVHLYGKQPRPGRKLGHVTVLGEDTEQALERARAVVARVTGDKET